MWDLDKYFPKLNGVNRGFGGSEIADSIHFADRIIIKHRPKKVLLYAGDNDIAKGKTAEIVFNDFKKFFTGCFYPSTIYNCLSILEQS